MTREGWIGVAQAGAAAACFSLGAILVRWAQPLSPTHVTSLRLLLGGAFVGMAALGSGERVRLQRAVLLRLTPIALAAAVHFPTFISSLYFTTVAHSLTLTYTAPP